MPDARADCAMAHMAAPETIRRMRETYDDLAVVCYINSTAELKRCSDVCVTSANALKIVKALPNRNIFFIPDRNLAHYIAQMNAGEKHFVYNKGFCPVHEQMQVSEIRKGEGGASGRAGADASGMSGGSAGNVRLCGKHFRNYRLRGEE